MRLTRRVTSELALGAVLIGAVVGACGDNETGDGNAATTTTPTSNPTGVAPTASDPGPGLTSNPSGSVSTPVPGPSGPVTSTPPATGPTAMGPTGTVGVAPMGSTGTPAPSATDPGPGAGGTSSVGPGPGAGGSTPGAGGDISAGGGGGGGPVGPDGPEVTVRLSRENQMIQGFGINTALSSNNIPINTMFDTEGPDGIGMSILRIGMNSSGQLTGTGISEAKAKGAKVIGSTWSPPGRCKSNGKETDGGYVLESCYEEWADTIANFAKNQGLYAMSIANESDFASCPGVPVCTTSYETTTYTGKQMVAWVKVAGPKLKAAGVKVIAPEASEWIHAWSNISGTGSIVSSHPHSSDPHGCGCFGNEITPELEATCAQKCLDGDGYDYGHWLWKDQDAWAAFDILGVHEYDSQIAFPWPDDVNGGVRDKEVWQTEMSGVRHWPEEGPSTSIENGVAVAGWIHSALTVGEASAWLYWWYQAYYEDDNEGLGLLKSGNTIAKRYYTFGNYSKFVRPEYIAVDMTGDMPEDVLLSAYKGPDGTVVVVAINKSGSTKNVPIYIDGTAPASMATWLTSKDDNLAEKDAVAVADGMFDAELPAMSVTTFVGK